MAKKKLNPIAAYIAHCIEWARICRETVYGKKITINGEEVQLFNFDLDKEFDYHCPTRSDAVKIKGEYRGSGTYKAYYLLNCAERSEREAELLEHQGFLEELEILAIRCNYKDGSDLIRKSMHYDEDAQRIRDQLFALFVL